MLIKNILFLGLAAFAAANPLLEDRATSKAVAGSKTGKKGKVDTCDNTSALTTGVTCPRVKFTAAQIQRAVKQAKAMKLKGKKGKGIHFPAKYKHDKEVKIKVKGAKGAKGKGAKAKTGKRDLEDGEQHEDDEDEVLSDVEEDGDDDDEDDDDEVLEDDDDVDEEEEEKEEEEDEHPDIESPEDYDHEGQSWVKSLVTRALEASRGRGGGGRSRSRPKPSRPTRPKPTKPKTTKPKTTKPKTTKQKTTKTKTTKPKTTKPKKEKCKKAGPVKVGKGVWMFPILKKGVWKPGMMPELNYVILDRKYNYVKTAEREPGSAEEFDICVENPKKGGKAAKGKTTKGKAAA